MNHKREINIRMETVKADSVKDCENEMASSVYGNYQSPAFIIEDTFSPNKTSSSKMGGSPYKKKSRRIHSLYAWFFLLNRPKIDTYNFLEYCSKSEINESEYTIV